MSYLHITLHEFWRKLRLSRLYLGFRYFVNYYHCKRIVAEVINYCRGVPDKGDTFPFPHRKTRRLREREREKNSLPCEGHVPLPARSLCSLPCDSFRQTPPPPERKKNTQYAITQFDSQDCSNRCSLRVSWWTHFSTNPDCVLCLKCVEWYLRQAQKG